MPKAQRKLIPEETFLGYFGMRRPPFGPPLDPLEIFDCEQYSLLNERLASATEHAGSLAVICGVDGSGKTTLLNRYVGNLPENIACARFDETCQTGKQFYVEFLKQLGFDEISGTLNEFRNITREFLVYQGSVGNPILILMDNAHLVKPSVLEQLRWISATKIKERSILSVVLAGNADLLRIMASPAMRSLNFDHRADFNVRVFTESETDAYVWHCLNASGGANVAKFSNEAHAMIYRYTGGIPGQINALCSATLAEACARENRVIHDKLVRVVADKEKMLPHAVPLNNNGRRKTDENCESNVEAEQTEPAEEQSGAKKPVPKKTGTKRKATTAKLTADLRKEKRATKTAKADVGKAKALIGKLEKQVTELQASVSNLTADFKRANCQVAESDELGSELQTSESLELSLAERDSRIAELETALTAHASDLTTSQAELRPRTGPSGKQHSSNDAILSIEVLKGGSCEQVLDISQVQARVMVGRADDSELRLSGQFVSRHHALIFLSENEVLIEDLNSFNGTIVNGKKITRRKISPGDKINIGDYELRTRPA